MNNVSTKQSRTSCLFSLHPELKSTGHKTYNVINNVSTNTSYTIKHLRPLILNNQY